MGKRSPWEFHLLSLLFIFINILITFFCFTNGRLRVKVTPPLHQISTEREALRRHLIRGTQRWKDLWRLGPGPPPQ
ncbi:hypothetical protein COLO4_05847 [Corchorus olitorius]|uniref:Uncharacterized protein n=1 Tax=Corchorus olitorius TaxID=93759 RepID=A0A1R3KPQ0_9ROSI|nr:hypothetical protein COLO4_05847 [Corchorus olitorius]